MAAVVGVALVAGVTATVAVGQDGAVHAGRAGAVGPAGGGVALYLTAESPTKSAVVATGAIGDYGTSVSVDRDGHPDPQGDYARVTLKQGAFTIDGRAFQKNVSRARPSINPRTCSFVVHGQGRAPVSAGTGAYAGISGALMLRSTFAAIDPRGSSGACRFSNSAPLSQYLSVTASGRVSFR
jgi:hypothetical protein